MRLSNALPNVLLNALAANRTDPQTPISYSLLRNLAFGAVAGADVANDVVPRHRHLHLLLGMRLLISPGRAKVGRTYYFRSPFDVLALLLPGCADGDGAYVFRAPPMAKKTLKHFHGHAKC